MSGECKAVLRVCPGKQVWCLTVVGDTLFVGASDGMVSCWSASSGRKHWSFRGPRDGVRRLAVGASQLYIISKHGYFAAYGFGDSEDSLSDGEVDDAAVARLSRVM